MASSDPPSPMVLLVDDNGQNLYLLQVLLCGHGYRVEIASNGLRALQLAGKTPPDLVISDILMPVMDGFALCMAWQADEKLRSIPFIFYTATYTDSKDEKLAISIGARRFVNKPQEPDALLKIIESELNPGGRELSPAALPVVEAEPLIMLEYNQALVRKLEEKMLQLEQTQILLEEKVGELQRTSAALEQSDQRFRDFASIAADWFFEIDSAFRINYVSQKYRTATGFNPQRLINQHVLEFFDCKEDESIANQLLKSLEANLEISDFESAQRLDDDSELMFRYSGMPFYDEDDVFSGYRFVAQDITESHSLSRRLTHQATHDALTGLVNRWEFDRRLHRLLASFSVDQQHALCYIDIDRFKIVNDTCGHVAGDRLLKQLADLLNACVRERDTLARIGGDEFVILMEHCSIEHARRVAEEVRHSIEMHYFNFDEQTFNVTASVGLVDISPLGNNFSAVLSAADVACYAAKDQGGNRIYIYSPDDDEIIGWQRDRIWTNSISNAMNEGRLVLYAQEIVPVASSTGLSQHFELLIRMIDEQGRVIRPDEFLPAAEKYNLMHKIDRWVIESAFQWIDRQKSSGAPVPRLSINLSGSSLGDDDLLEYLLDQFKQHIDPTCICFEITETLAVSSYLRANSFIGKLRELGCRISIDDFGSGVCSYAYLRRLDFDYIKIDGLFVRAAAENPIDMAVVRSINEIGHLMGKQTVAEYVENDDIRQKLEGIGIDFAQGYEIHEPMALNDIVIRGGKK